jgi:hypothetical protein
LPPEKEKKQQAGAKRPPRKTVLLAGIVAHADGTHSLVCTFRDLSQGGARIAIKKNAQPPASFYLINIRDRVAYDARLAWSTGSEAGVSFQKILPLADITDARLGFLKRLWLSRATR